MVRYSEELIDDIKNLKTKVDAGASQLISQLFFDNNCFYDFLEKERLLLPTHDFSYVAQESFAFNTELPRDKAETTRDVWGFLESQETTAVSKEMFGE